MSDGPSGSWEKSQNFKNAKNYTMIEKNTQLPYIESEIFDFCKNKFMLNRINNSTSTYGNEIYVIKEKTVNLMLRDFLSKIEESDPTFIRFSDRQTTIEGKGCFITTYTSSQSIRIDFSGDRYIIDQVNDEVRKKFQVITNNINWITSTDMNSVSVPLIQPKGVNDSAYPFIGNMEKFISDFAESSANVLLLIGPPGTGKSNFIKYIISCGSKDGMLTFDHDVANKDSLYGEYIDSNCGFLIFEDAEILLDGTREDGNKNMHRLLNTSDGLVSSMNKKIIFSTNLSSTNEIDQALLRPGRCFSVLEFRALTYDESVSFLTVRDMQETIPKLIFGKSYTLAELYAFQQPNNTREVTTRKVGFI